MRLKKPHYEKPFIVASRENSCSNGILQKLSKSVSSLFSSLTSSRPEKKETAAVIVNDYSRPPDNYIEEQTPEITKPLSLKRPNAAGESESTLIYKR